MKIYLINGPNLNLLGTREPEIYGSETLSDIEKSLAAEAAKAGYELIPFQSNHEGFIIDKIHEAAREKVSGIIINAGAYSHTSYAIRDALKGAGVPSVEVHLSNIAAREEFRHISVLSAVCVGVIFGLGSHGYSAALNYFISKGHLK